jgi:hypothetical protein
MCVCVYSTNCLWQFAIFSVQFDQTCNSLKTARICDRNMTYRYKNTVQLVGIKFYWVTDGVLNWQLYLTKELVIDCHNNFLNFILKVICVDQHEAGDCTNTVTTAQLWCSVIADKIARLRCYHRVLASPHHVLQSDLSVNVNEFPLAHYISDRHTPTNAPPQTVPTLQHWATMQTSYRTEFQ